MSKLIRGTVAAAFAAATLAVPTAAFAEPDNWGQAVKDCNQTSCYPGGTSRGGYVSDQARDNDGPGYGREIHDLANPGNSNPRGLR